MVCTELEKSYYSIQQMATLNVKATQVDKALYFLDDIISILVSSEPQFPDLM